MKRMGDGNIGGIIDCSDGWLVGDPCQEETVSLARLASIGIGGRTPGDVNINVTVNADDVDTISKFDRALMAMINSAENG